MLSWRVFVSKPIDDSDSTKNRPDVAFAAVLKQVLAASPATVRASSVAAKAEPFSSHKRFAPRPARAS